MLEILEKIVTEIVRYIWLLVGGSMFFVIMIAYSEHMTAFLFFAFCIIMQKLEDITREVTK